MTGTSVRHGRNAHIGEFVLLRGWIYRLRTLRETTFVVLRDCSGEIQCVGATAKLRQTQAKQDDAVEIQGTVRADARAKGGSEVDIERLTVLNPASHKLPFNSAQTIDSVGLDTQLEYRPLSMRTERVRDIFAIQNALRPCALTAERSCTADWRPSSTTRMPRRTGG